MKNTFVLMAIACPVVLAFTRMTISIFRLSKSVSVNSNSYINDCLQPKLLSFIRKHHSDFNYLFLPDLAWAHYSNENVAWMKENVHFVEKSSNPPNVPQARPIENLRGIEHRKFMREDGWPKHSRTWLAAFNRNCKYCID